MKEAKTIVDSLLSDDKKTIDQALSEVQIGASGKSDAPGRTEIESR